MILNALLLALAFNAALAEELKSGHTKELKNWMSEHLASKQDANNINSSLAGIMDYAQNITESLLKLEKFFTGESHNLQAQVAELTKNNKKLKEDADKIEKILKDLVENVYKNFTSNLSNILSYSPTLAAMIYYQLYKFAEPKETFQLCHRLTLLTKLKSLELDSDSFIKPKVDKLLESLPKSISGIIGKQKMRISDQNNTVSLIAGSEYDYYRINTGVVSVHEAPTWVFVPADDICSGFRIRSNKPDGMQLIADSLTINGQRKLTLKKTMSDSADGLWQLQDVDWRNDTYILHNQFRAGYLNIDDIKKLAYVSVTRQQDGFQVVKLHIN